MVSHMSIPRAFWDSSNVIEARKKVQKSWEKENFWAWYTLRRVSIYISLFLANKTEVTPNAITVLGSMFGVLAGVVFLVGEPWAMVSGVLLYQLAFLCDCIDGEVARLKNSTSKEGAWLDLGLRYSLFFAFIMAVTRILGKLSMRMGLVVNAIMIINLLLSILTETGADSKLDISLANDVSNVKKKSKLLDGLICIFATEPGFYLGILVLFLLECEVTWSLAYIWTFWHLLIFCAKSIFRTMMIVLRFRRHSA